MFFAFAPYPPSDKKMIVVHQLRPSNSRNAGSDKKPPGRRHGIDKGTSDAPPASMLSNRPLVRWKTWTVNFARRAREKPRKAIAHGRWR